MHHVHHLRDGQPLANQCKVKTFICLETKFLVYISTKIKIFCCTFRFSHCHLPNVHNWLLATEIYICLRLERLSAGLCCIWVPWGLKVLLHTTGSLWVKTYFPFLLCWVFSAPAVFTLTQPDKMLSDVRYPWWYIAGKHSVWHWFCVAPNRSKRHVDIWRFGSVPFVHPDVAAPGAAGQWATTGLTSSSQDKHQKTGLIQIKNDLTLTLMIYTFFII